MRMRYGTKPPSRDFGKAKHNLASNEKDGYPKNKKEKLSWEFGYHSFGRDIKYPRKETPEQKTKRIRKEALSMLIPNESYYIEPEEQTLEGDNKKIKHYEHSYILPSDTQSVDRKRRLNLIIVEDIIEIRDEIKKVLPELLEEFDVHIEVFGDLESAINVIRGDVRNLLYGNKKLLLDNTFPVNKNPLTREGSNSGSNLYNFICSGLNDFNLKKIRENIAVISGLKLEILQRRYEGLPLENIISGKDDNFDEFIKKVADWIREKEESTFRI